jgi:signal transduction histidine kinase
MRSFVRQRFFFSAKIPRPGVARRNRFLFVAAGAMTLVLLFCQNVSAEYYKLTTPQNLTPAAEKAKAELVVGSWIWTTNFDDKQICRFWRSFSLPENDHVRQAILRITADNSYHLYLDGRDIGEGSNWKALTEYDITFLLTPGTHVAAIEAFNDNREAGVLLGMQITLASGKQIQIVSDDSWRIAPNTSRRWLSRTRAEPKWAPATIVGVVGQSPWWLTPVNIITPPPLLPSELRFWQSTWFMGAVLTVCVVALGLSLRLAAKLALQTRAQQLLDLERVRIARDIHDDLGAALTQLVLQCEVAQTEFPEESTARAHFNQFCGRARAASQALDEVVWAVNSKRDTLRDFSSYLCKYAQMALSNTPIRCRLDIQPDMPAIVFDLSARRGLFLAVKESLNNAAKHSAATELLLCIYKEHEHVVVIVEDQGRGFDPALLNGEGNGLQNMTQRLEELGGTCRIMSAVDAGCRVEFRMPLAHPAARGGSSWRRIFGPRNADSVDNSWQNREEQQP